MNSLPDVDATVSRIEELMAGLGEADPSLSQAAEELVRGLMALYGAALERIVEAVGADTAARLSEDRLVGSLLLLHDLHPVSAEARVAEALAGVGRRLGVSLAITEISADHLRVRVTSDGGPFPSASIAALIERAVAAEAPEITAVEIEGLEPPSVALVQIAPAASR